MNPTPYKVGLPSPKSLDKCPDSQNEKISVRPSVRKYFSMGNVPRVCPVPCEFFVDPRLFLPLGKVIEGDDVTLPPGKFCGSTPHTAAIHNSLYNRLEERINLVFFIQVGVSDSLYHFLHDLWLESAPIGELS